jgi:hypothetical protein
MPRITFFICLIFSLPLVQAQPPDLAGKTELSLHGGLDFQGPNGDKIELSGGYGWFLGDDWLLGGEYQWSVIEDIAPNENDYRAQQANLFAERLFIGKSDLVPYIGAEIGFRNSKFTDLDESGLIFGGRIGARYFLTESVSIDTSIRLLVADKKVFIVDFDAEDQYIYPSIGLKAVF